MVWDFDGVLVDSRAEAWRAGAEILALLGLEIDIRSQDEFRRYFSPGGAVDASEVPVLRAMHRLVMRSRAHLLKPCPCLALVPRQSVPAEIVTSGLSSLVRQVLGEAADLFTRIRGHEAGSKDELLRSVSANALCITDTIVDVARCRQQSRAVVAVGWGYDSRQALETAGPSFFVDSPRQLEELFRWLGLLRDRIC